MSGGPLDGHGLDDVALVQAGAGCVVGIEYSQVAVRAAQRRADERPAFPDSCSTLSAFPWMTWQGGGHCSPRRCRKAAVRSPTASVPGLMRYSVSRSAGAGRRPDAGRTEAQSGANLAGCENVTHGKRDTVKM